MHQAVRLPIKNLTERQNIFEIHSELTGAGEMPPLRRLQEVIERESHAWQDHDQWRPLEDEDDTPKRGELVAKWYVDSRDRNWNGNTADKVNSQLRNTGTTTGQWLEIYRQGDDDDEHLTIITGGTVRQDRVPLRLVRTDPSSTKPC